ncbi:MAG: SCO family protein [Candidatus Omnitrophica bacterium]|nr:SCO family protein [Candidatus Omnitrophota bacterium]
MRKGFLVSVLVINAFALAVLCVTNFQQAKRSGSPPMPVHGRVSDFSLLDQDQTVITPKTLAGRPWVANFMFTRCAGACPAMGWTMKGLQGSLNSVRLVSFSVDPEKDDPATLKKYAEGYSAVSGRWFFLTGDRKTIEEVSNSMHLGSLGELSAHSLRLVLVDPTGGIRGYYDSEDPKAVQKLIRDAGRLAAESSR